MRTPLQKMGVSEVAVDTPAKRPPKRITIPMCAKIWAGYSKSLKM
jgi:hypothetical protein